MKFSEFEQIYEEKLERLKKEDSGTVNSIEEELKKYENLSEQELMQEFLKESKKQKANGDLNDEKLNNIKETLSPFLNKEQLSKLNDLLGLI